MKVKVEVTPPTSDAPPWWWMAIGVLVSVWVSGSSWWAAVSLWRWIWS